MPSSIEPPRGKLGRGIAGAPVRAVGKRAPFAIVSRVPRSPGPDAARLRAHDRVVRRVAAAKTAILPARFGCVVDHDEELAQLLAPAAPSSAPRSTRSVTASR